MAKGPNDGAPGGSDNVMGGTGTENISPGNDGTAAEPVMFKVVTATKRDALDAMADKDYPGWRDGNAQDLPLESVSAKDLIATQKYVHRPKVEKEKAKFRKRGGYKKDPLVMKHGGRFYIRDGHHRSQAAVEDGAPAIPVRVMDLDGSGIAKGTQEKPRKSSRISDSDAYAETNNIKVCVGGPVASGYDSTKSNGTHYDGTAPVSKEQPGGAGVHTDAALGGKKRKKIKLGKAWSLTVPITKTDDSTQTVYGWASVISDGGGIVTDHQGDQIEPAELVKAAHDFMQASREGGLMHIDKVKGGSIVESVIFTREVQKALGINLGKVGWFIGYKVDDPEVYKLCKGPNAVLKDFSIGGSGVRVPV